MPVVSVKVEADHLERLAKRGKPILALEELIWNALDADATEVTVAFSFGTLGAITEITVTDNGEGIPAYEAPGAFGNLGGSWKRSAGRTRGKGRILHGKTGSGRFRAYNLGEKIIWRTWYKINDKMMEYSIKAGLGKITTFVIGDERTSTVTTAGTSVSISDVKENFGSLIGSNAVDEITQKFALYLHNYRDVSIIYNGQKLDPNLIIKEITEIELPATLVNNAEYPVALAIAEWTKSMSASLVLCDQDGFAFRDGSIGMNAMNHYFTAYIKSQAIPILHAENTLILDDLEDTRRELVNNAREAARDHFRKLDAMAASNFVTEWEKEKIYPYTSPPNSPLEKAERQVFDVIASNINNYLPNFEQTDHKNKLLTLRLLKEAVERSPRTIVPILNEVFNLSKEHQEELAHLLTKTSLAAIITSAKIVSERLDFLAGLEIIVFDTKKEAKERKELHRILANETWIFGEEFNLTNDDESLTKVLDKHLAMLGKHRSDKIGVVTNDGSRGIVDLVLSRVVPQIRPEQREHLAVELKRPNQPVDDSVVVQIKKYARAIAEDERFRDTQTKWHFYAISNELSESVRYDVRQKGRPVGLLYDDPDGVFFIWAKTWAQIIEGCRTKLQFFRDNLEYTPSTEEAPKYLRQEHEKYLPSTLKEKPHPVSSGS